MAGFGFRPKVKSDGGLGKEDDTNRDLRALSPVQRGRRDKGGREEGGTDAEAW